MFEEYILLNENFVLPCIFSLMSFQDLYFVLQFYFYSFIHAQHLYIFHSNCALFALFARVLSYSKNRDCNTDNIESKICINCAHVLCNFFFFFHGKPRTLDLDDSLQQRKQESSQEGIFFKRREAL